MYDPQQMRALRAEVAQAVKAQDPVAALQEPPKSVEGGEALIHVAADCAVLSEAALTRYIGTFFQRKDRARLASAVADQRLGHPSLRAYWDFSARFRDSDPTLRLADMVASYRTCPPGSSSRLRFVHLLCGQAFRNCEFDFISAWTEGATDPELTSVPNRYFYGLLIGMIRDGRRALARDLLARRAPQMSALDHLFFTVPRWMLAEREEAPPTTDALVAALHKALPGRGPEWDWFCTAYREKISLAGQDFTNIRMEPDRAQALRDIIFQAVTDAQPLSFQRMGDGAAYRMALPDCAQGVLDMLRDDDRSREEAWWQRTVATERGDFFALEVAQALQCADVLGVCSAHRLIRDAVPEVAMTASVTGRALLAHVNALGTQVPLDDKIVTEDRAHTILYTRAFLKRLCRAARNVVVVGGLSPSQMGLRKADDATYIPLLPEQNKGLPVAQGAVSIVDDYEALQARISAESGPGTLLLVSGGYVGKGLVHSGKIAGAVALDIGSRADTLAGHHTRSPADAV
ncbi:MAG: hypothetical protein AAF340_11060 [Pseudomonadota bacterium]